MLSDRTRYLPSRTLTGHGFVSRAVRYDGSVENEAQLGRPVTHREADPLAPRLPLARVGGELVGAIGEDGAARHSALVGEHDPSLAPSVPAHREGSDYQRGSGARLAALVLYPSFHAGSAKATSWSGRDVENRESPTERCRVPRESTKYKT